MRSVAPFRARRVSLATLAAALIGATLAVVASPAPNAQAAIGLPVGFSDTTIVSGLAAPTAFDFASDGRVFVLEKAGALKGYANIADTTPDVYDFDANDQVHSFWDRGANGFTLDPGLTTGRPYAYVLYTFNAKIGGTAPTWTEAECFDRMGADQAGCLASGRLVRVTISGNGTGTTVVPGSEKVLVNDWCIVYNTHSIGTVTFGPDGGLYVGGGEGAGAGLAADTGSFGNNGCNDPPNEGGALRSQSFRRTDGPAVLAGTISRVDPDTGAPMPDNPNIASPDVNRQRVVAYGLRNPYRFTFKPGTNELWIGDVGMSLYEEINRVENPLGATKNFGWPCYEGAEKFDITVYPAPGYQGAGMCQSLYTAGTATAPYFQYRHQLGGPDFCSFGNSGTFVGSSITAISFHPGGSYPGAYDDAVVLRRLQPPLHLRHVAWPRRAPESRQHPGLRTRTTTGPGFGGQSLWASRSRACRSQSGADVGR